MDGFLVVLGLLLVAILLSSARIIRHQREIEKEFKRFFDFLPSERSNVAARLVEQRFVDEVLRALARTFNTACQEEARAFGNSPVTIHGLEEYRANVDRAKRKVAYTKIEFWRAHKLAKGSGFNVREKCGDYLTAVPA